MTTDKERLARLETMTQETNRVLEVISKDIKEIKDNLPNFITRSEFTEHRKSSAFGAIQMSLLTGLLAAILTYLLTYWFQTR